MNQYIIISIYHLMIDYEKLFNKFYLFKNCHVNVNPKNGNSLKRS